MKSFFFLCRFLHIKAFPEDAQKIVCCSATAAQADLNICRCFPFAPPFWYTGCSIKVQFVLKLQALKTDSSKMSGLSQESGTINLTQPFWCWCWNRCFNRKRVCLSGFHPCGQMLPWHQGWGEARKWWANDDCILCKWTAFLNQGTNYCWGLEYKQEVD